MLALCLMLSGTYYAQNYVSVIGGSLHIIEAFTVCGICRLNHCSYFPLDHGLVHNNKLTYSRSEKIMNFYNSNLILKIIAVNPES